MWLSNVYYGTNLKLPSFQRRSEIIRKIEMLLSPVENAVASVAGKNREVDEMITFVENEPKADLKPFIMLLSGVIDAAVNGGIAKYQDAFFSQAYQDNNPENGKYVLLIM